MLRYSFISKFYAVTVYTRRQEVTRRSRLINYKGSASPQPQSSKQVEDHDQCVHNSRWDIKANSEGFKSSRNEECMPDQMVGVRSARCDESSAGLSEIGIF